MNYEKMNENKDLEFKPLKYSDIFQCINIMKENYSDIKTYWSDVLHKDLCEVLNDDKIYKTNCLTVWNKKEHIGFGYYVHSKMCSDMYELCWINIKKEYQNKGIGKKLIVALENDIKNKTNEAPTLIFVTDKPYFYEKLGYKTVYKIDNEDLMIKELL